VDSLTYTLYAAVLLLSDVAFVKTSCLYANSESGRALKVGEAS